MVINAGMRSQILCKPIKGIYHVHQRDQKAKVYF